jgi:hypothetical protein
MVAGNGATGDNVFNAAFRRRIISARRRIITRPKRRILELDKPSTPGRSPAVRKSLELGRA